MPRPDPTAVARPRTRSERAALSAATAFAERHDLGPPPERPYLQALPAARTDVLHRFLRGILRGGVTELGLPEPWVGDPGSIPDDVLPDGAPTDWPEEFDGDGAGTLRGPATHERVGVVSFPEAGRSVVVPVEAVGGYDRYHLGAPVVVVGPDESGRLRHPVDLVGLLDEAGAFDDPEQSDVVEAEVAESVANLAAAMVAERVLARERQKPGEGAAPGAVAAADRPAALERLVTRGHPFHPGGKIRRGMTAGGGVAYAPEFTPTIHVRFVAVHDSVARRVAAGSGRLSDRLYDAFDGLRASVETAVEGTDDDYAVVPVHPWQFHHVIRDRYADAIDDGRVVPLSFAWPATPLLNLRTVVPYATREGAASAAPGEPDAAPALPHCKLAIGVRTTNVERTLSPQAVHNGPETTRVWRAIERAADLETLGALEEPAGASYYPSGGPHLEGEGYDDARHLAALLRKNPRTHPLAAGDRRPVPAAALVAGGPESGTPLVREVLDGQWDATPTDARAFLEAYAETVVPPQLRLLTTYGIALETHLQNSYVVLEDGVPVGTLVRDFGGIRVDAERLTDHGLTFEPYPDSDPDADGPSDLHRKLYYALFQNHLSEVVAALVASSGLDEATCWRTVAATCRETFERLRADPAVPDDRIDADEAALLADPVPFKALTKMRLQGKRHAYATSQVSNPLAGERE